MVRFSTVIQAPLGRAGLLDREVQGLLLGQVDLVYRLDPAPMRLGRLDLLDRRVLCCLEGPVLQSLRLHRLDRLDLWVLHWDLLDLRSQSHQLDLLDQSDLLLDLPDLWDPGCRADPGA